MGSNAAYELLDEQHEDAGRERSGVGSASRGEAEAASGSRHEGTAGETLPRRLPRWGSKPHTTLSRAPTLPSSSTLSIEEPTPPSIPWCVDHGERLEAMTTIELWNALESGAVPQGTRIWREGMECWTPAREVRALYWTLSERDPIGSEPTASNAPAHEPPCVALTPQEIASVVPLWAESHPVDRKPTSTRGERAAAPTLPSVSHERADEGAAAARDLAGPISLDLPAGFPDAPDLTPEPPTLRVTSSATIAAPKPSAAPRPVPRFGPPPPLPAGAACARTAPSLSLSWPAGARRGARLRSAAASLVRNRRDALALAAGCAIAVLSLSLTALSAATPDRATPRAQPGRLAAAALAPARAAAASVAATRPSPAQAAEAPATRPGARPAPSGHNERGQVRLRRGRSDSGRGPRARGNK